MLHPLDASDPRPVEFVDKIPALTAQERELILSGNAARVLKLLFKSVSRAVI